MIIEMLALKRQFINLTLELQRQNQDQGESSQTSGQQDSALV